MIEIVTYCRNFSLTVDSIAHLKIFFWDDKTIGFILKTDNIYCVHIYSSNEQFFVNIGISKNIYVYFTSVPTSIPLETQSVRVFETHSASNCIDADTGIDFLFFLIHYIE